MVQTLNLLKTTYASIKLCDNYHRNLSIYSDGEMKPQQLVSKFRNMGRPRCAAVGLQQAPLHHPYQQYRDYV